PIARPPNGSCRRRGSARSRVRRTIGATSPVPMWAGSLASRAITFTPLGLPRFQLGAVADTPETPLTGIGEARPALRAWRGLRRGTVSHPGCRLGGGGEIRTRGGVTATRLFESRTLNRSDTPPGGHCKLRGYRLLAGAMPGHLRPVAAAAHTAPLSLPGSRGVLEDPVALRIFTDPQPRRIALDQLAGDRLGQPGDRAVDGISLVTMIERYAVRRGHEFVDVVGAQRPIDLGEVTRVGSPPGGGRFQHATHRLAGAAQPAQHLEAAAR